MSARKQTMCPRCRPDFEWTYDIGCPSRHPENADLRCFREAGHRGMHVADDWHCTIEPKTVLRAGRPPMHLSIHASWSNERYASAGRPSISNDEGVTRGDA